MLKLYWIILIYRYFGFLPLAEEEDEDFQFGGYQPSVVSTSSRPTSRRSVRYLLTRANLKYLLPFFEPNNTYRFYSF